MRIVHWLALLSMLIVPAAATAQESDAFLRLGANWSGAPGEPTDPGNPDPNPNGQEPQFFLSYPTLNIEQDESVGTMKPAVTGDLASTEFSEWYAADVPEGLDFNFQTGEITGTPSEAGVLSFMVYHNRQAREPNEQGQYLGYQARAQVRINVAAEYVIEVNPPVLSFVYGRGPSVSPASVVAATNAPQTGGTWGIDRSTAFDPPGELAQPSITLDPVNDIWPGTFQFYYQKPDGVRVNSEPVTVDVTYAPSYWFPQNATSSYNAFWDDTADVAVMEIKPGISLNVAAEAYYGAISVPPAAQRPAWLAPMGNLPPGLSLSTNAVLTGFTSAPVGSTYTVNVPARSSDDRYGSSTFEFRVVSAFSEDDGEDPGGGWCEANEEWWWEDPENTHGCATEDEYNEKWCEIHADDWYDYDPDNGHGCGPCYDETGEETECSVPEPVDNGPYGDGDLGPFDWNLYPVCPLSSPYAGISWDLNENTGNSTEYMKWFKGNCHCQEWESSTTASYRVRTEAELARIRRGDPSSAHAICRTSPYHLSIGYFNGFPQYDSDNNITP